MHDRGRGRATRRRGPGPSTAAAPPRSPRWSARSRAPTAGSPASAASSPPRAPTRSSSSSTTSAAIWKYNPLADWTERDLWQRIHERDLPYHPLHDQGYASIGCAPCTQPGSGREGRWAGTDKIECGLHVPAWRRRACTLTHLQALEAEAIHVMREVAAELERPVLLFSGGKDSIVLLRLAEKAFRPARFPFPLMHVDTGHNFPEVIEFRDRRVAELGERLIVASVQESIDARPRRRGDRPARVAQPPADDDAARRDRRARLRRGLRRRAPRRGARPRQGAHLLLPRRLRRLGPQAPAPRAVEPLQRPHPPRRARPRLPAVATGPSSTCGSTSPEEELEVPVDLLRPRARGLPPRRDALRRLASTSSCIDGEAAVHRRACATAPSAT